MLYSISVPGVPYTVKYGHMNALDKYAIIRDDKVMLTVFEVQALLHSGGTVLYQLTLNQVSFLFLTSKREDNKLPSML